MISGHDLTPGDEAVTIEVEVIAPDQQNEEFTGEVRVVNTDNPDEFEIIDVSLKTPRTRAINIPFLRFLQNHPHIFSIRGYLLEL